MGHQCPRRRNVTSDVVALNLPFPEAVRTGSNSPKAATPKGLTTIASIDFGVEVAIGEVGD